MFFNEWNVLVVDDDPDVLAVTKLALKDVRVYGLPIKVHTARGKTEAIGLLTGPLRLEGTPEPLVAVALVDVVMESDRAGLELCKYIREEAGGHSIQLYIRTGQPGVAPEREVIDSYDISGYFTKVELTQQKLYTLVKSGIRQWFTIWYAMLLEEQTNNLVTHATSRKAFLEGLGWFGEDGPRTGEPVTGFKFDNQVIASDYPREVQAIHDRLDPLPATIQSPEGHKLVMEKSGTLMVKTVKTKTTANYFYVAESTMVLPRMLLDLTFRKGLVYSMLWKRAGEAEKGSAGRGAKTKPPRKKVAVQTAKKRAPKPAKRSAKKVARRSRR